MKEVHQLEIIQSNPQQYSQIHSQYNQSLFTHHHWIESISNENTEPIYWLIKKDGEIVAKIAGLSVQGSWLRGKELYFYSAPQIICSAVTDMRQVLESILSYAKQNYYNRLVISSYDNWQNLIEAIPESYLNQREDYVFDLTLPNPHLIHSSRFKKNYKKSLLTHPQVVENSTSEGISNLLHLLKTTHHIRLSKYSDYDVFYLPHTNEHQLQKLIDNKMGRVYEIRVENQVHGIALNLEANHSVFALFMAYDEFAYKNGLAAYFFYQLIDRYKNEGFTRFNLGGIPKGKENSGIKVFKESIGAQSIRLNGLTTNFLLYPQKILNPILHLVRMMKKLHN